jgi:erythronate-4-phosphate dehydrogenase
LVPLGPLLQTSDIVTCHVPLTTAGENATYHLLNERTLGMLDSSAILINTARGSVVNNAALLKALKGHLGGAVLDVWEGEPSPDPALIHAVALGTPHIAGYSLDGKIKGTQMLYEAACAHFQRTARWRPPETAVEQGQRVVIQGNKPIVEVVRALVQRAYAIRRDDETFRAIASLSLRERGQAFDRLRAYYPPRWEFHNIKVVLSGASRVHAQTLTRLGFTVEEGTP